MVKTRVSEPEPGYLAGAGAFTLARLHLKYLFNNSRKLHGTYHHLMSFLKNIKYDIHVLVHVLESILDNS